MDDRREFDFIDAIRRQQGRDPRVPVGIGDDTAVLFGGPRDWLATVDMLVEGVHFDRKTMTAAEIGRKAMAVNLSDIAAMAGDPVAALVAIALPRGVESNCGTEVLRGIRQLGDDFHTTIVGGDTNRSAGGLVISVTLLGHPTGRGAVLRSGAKVGDVVCVTGHLGYSIAGHHWQFLPRVAEAKKLHRDYQLNAMLDLSDGLASDIFHIVRESRCGLVIHEKSIPIAAPVIDDNRSPIEHALNDGEDFELLFTLPKGEAERLISDQPLSVPVTAIGEVVAGDSVTFVRLSGSRETLAPGGFVHEW